jgi:hypothetical protein
MNLRDQTYADVSNTAVVRDIGLLAAAPGGALALEDAVGGRRHVCLKVGETD